MQRIVQIFVLLLVGFAVFGVNHIVEYNRAVTRANQEVLLNPEPPVLKVFAKVRHSAPSFSSTPEPAKLWRGDTAQVIAVIPGRSRSIAGAQYRWKVYAKTAKGAYFAVAVYLASEAPPEDLREKRLYTWGVGEISADALRLALFHAKRFDLYRKEFGEEPPTVEIEA